MSWSVSSDRRALDCSARSSAILSWNLSRSLSLSLSNNKQMRRGRNLLYFHFHFYLVCWLLTKPAALARRREFRQQQQPPPATLRLAYNCNYYYRSCYYSPHLMAQLELLWLDFQQLERRDG